MAFVKQKPPLLAEIGSKSVVLGEQGRFIFHAGRRNPKQGRYFFQSIPIAMRHGGHERRVSASASFPWPKQVVAMKMKRSVSETAAGGATQVAQLRLLKPTARKKSPCCECLRRKRDNFRPACRKWREMGDFCGVWRVLYRLGWTGVCAGRVLYRLGWTGVCAGRVLSRFGQASMRAGRVLSRLARETVHRGCPGCGPPRNQALPYLAQWQRPARPTWPRPRPLALAGECEVHEEQVERDDDGRNEETGDAQGTIVRVAAHDLGRGGQAHERDDREGDAE